MIGIFALIVLFICYLVKCHDDAETRENYPNRYYYQDKNGVKRLRTWPHTKVFNTKLNNGHLVLMDSNHNVLVDMTAEDQKREWELHPERKPNYEEIKLAGYTVKKYTSQNGTPYSVFHYKDADWNFDLNSLKIIGPTEAQVEREVTYKNHGLLNFTPEGFKAVMDEFNALPERERAGIAAECDGSLCQIRSYFNTVYNPSRMKRYGWSYFAQKGIPLEGDKPWIK